MRAHRGWLSSVVYARVRSNEAVEDVLQETALAASRQTIFENDQDGIFRWLYRVAIRQAMLYLRNQSRADQRIKRVHQRTESNEANRTQAEDPLHVLIASENRQLVRTALDNLSSKDREILMLKYCDGWTCSEVGERLGASTSAIKSRLLRARRNLRAELLKLDNNWCSE